MYRALLYYHIFAIVSITYRNSEDTCRFTGQCGWKVKCLYLTLRPLIPMTTTERKSKSVSFSTMTNFTSNHSEWLCLHQKNWIFWIQKVWKISVRFICKSKATFLFLCSWFRKWVENYKLYSARLPHLAFTGPSVSPLIFGPYLKPQISHIAVVGTKPRISKMWKKLVTGNYIHLSL